MLADSVSLAPVHPKSISVFVVDDEHIIAASLAIILKNHGFDAKPFFEPHEALQAARSDAPDLLISDVVMPGMSGIDLAIQIQRECPGCKVLLFSGQAATGELLKAANQAGYDFELLTKPVHPKDLLASIKQIGQLESVPQ